MLAEFTVANTSGLMWTGPSYLEFTLSTKFGSGAPETVEELRALCALDGWLGCNVAGLLGVWIICGRVPLLGQVDCGDQCGAQVCKQGRCIRPR